MKNYISKLTLLFVVLATVGLTSCKKSETPEPTVTPQLAKVVFWNPSTGTESLSAEFIYDTKGTMTSLIYGGTTYTVAFDSSNKLASLTGTLKQGLIVTYTIEYSSAGQLVKVVYADGGTNANTKTITYNAAGKISKIGIVYTNTAITPYNAEYTWNGDNLATASSGTYITTYTTYDDKLNPYSLADGISVVFYGNPASKNNVTEIKTLNGTLTNAQKRTYEYNSAGYATSMKLLDGSNEGQKYYYR
ncbi:hypothetical protein EZ428_22705 [Pedobacter frigiditerrae]|uniref:YD repeat-containing protein n=1 Tax=Pedobacter frigiditerrae TaxID=2530452 RepID=A0A4R0MKU1_9SPHI|nr:hypothetical protein [Pedobacter frigiditerrae]TCC87017.1 hypothetical protein EZ428_22705 [Pedobacter frigiditerrae]